MTFEYFLSPLGTRNHIRLKIVDTKTSVEYDFYTLLKIASEDWDSEKQRPRNIYIKKYKKINLLLDQIKINVMAYVSEKRRKSRAVTHRSLYRLIHKICTDSSAMLQEGSLLHYMQLYISQRKELICNSTYKRYMVFFNLIRRFEGFTKKVLLIDQLNAEFVREFMIFGKNELYSENTLYRTIHFVRTILNFVEKKGIRTHIREIEVRREKQQQDIITLNENEIRKIKKIDLPQELQEARDWLLISCYTGQRFSDFINFSMDMILEIKTKSCIRFIQQKTKKEITLPLHPEVNAVLDRNQNAFPKKIDLHHYNEKIRQIARIAGIQTLVKARKRVGHRVKEVLIEKWQAITSHVGRRSFATNFYSKIPTSLLIAATGHSSENMFLKYINPVDDDRIVNLSNYFERINEREMIASSA